MGKYFLLVLLALSVSVSYAANPKWLNYNANRVVALAEETNYIWAGGSELARINKLTGEITKYNHLSGNYAANSTLPANDITGIAIDKSNNKWIATYGGGIARFDGTNWTVYNYNNSNIPDDYVLSIAVDENNYVWVGTDGSGLAKFDGKNWTVYSTDNSDIPDDYITSMAYDAVKKTLWVGTDYGLGGLKNNTWTVYNSSNSQLPDYSISSIYPDKTEARMIIGLYGGGLYSFSGVFKKVTIPDDYINSVAFSTANGVWVGTDGNGVDFSSIEMLNWTNLNTINSAITDDYIYSVLIDSKGDKWFGTYENGVVKYDGQNFTKYNISNSGSANDIVNHIVFDGTTAWLATEGGVESFDGNKWTVYNPANSGLPISSVNTVYVDNNGNKWVGTDVGLSMFKGAAWTIYNVAKNNLPNNIVKTVTGDGKNIWVGTNGGAAKFNGSSWSSLLKSNSSLPSDVVNVIKVDSKNVVWFGTNSGLAALNGTNWTVYDKTNTPMLDVHINSIAFDSSGNKWVGTDEGLLKFNGSIWTLYDSNNVGMLYYPVTSIAVDKSNKIWAATEGGMLSYDGTKWTEYYSSGSGLPENYLNDVAVDNYNNIWIGSDGSGLGIYNEAGITFSIKPEISSIQDVTTYVNTPALANFTVNGQTPGALKFVYYSSNQAVLPNTGMALGGSGTSRNITLTPAKDVTGSAIVTIKVTDGTDTASTQFNFKVVPKNKLTISSIQDMLFTSDSTAIEQFILGGGSFDNVKFEINSSNTALLPVANIKITGSQQNWSVSVTPVKGVYGSSTVTVRAISSGDTATAVFVVTVQKPNSAADEDNTITIGVSPNPANNFINITITNASGRAVINLFDLKGNKIAKIYEGQPESGPLNLKYDLNSLPSSAYFLEFDMGKTHKIVKMNVVR